MPETEKTTIPCGVCRDLMPLVQDGVASPESEQLVKAHIAACPACRALWERGAGEALPAELPAPDDRKILSAIRRKYNTGLLLFAALGLAAGFAVSSLGYGNWGALIFPFVCAMAVWYDPPIWRPIEVGTALLGAGMLVYDVVHTLLNGWSLDPASFLWEAVGWVLLLPGLCGIGCLIGWLLNYAFADKIRSKSRGKNRNKKIGGESK